MDELEELSRMRVGAVLRDRYRVEELIGMGGMASVYRGSHRNGNRVAIKILHPDLARSKEIAARFLKEGYVANAVGHSGAVRVLDDDTAADGAAFLVMELLEGKTVAARHEEAADRLPPEEVCKIAHQLLEVLVAAHAKGIVHRDLKPENLFLSRTGELKVLDFGIARMRDGAATSMTRSGHAMGTPAYMPPEQAMGTVRDVDGRTDLWAVGATMFTLLTGAFVHEAESAQQLLIFAATRPARKVRSLMPSLAPALADVINRALEFDKLKRFADAAAMLAAVEDAISTMVLGPAGAVTELIDGSQRHSMATALPRAAQPTPPMVAPTAHAIPPTILEEGAVPARSRSPVVPLTVDATVAPATAYAAPASAFQQAPQTQVPDIRISSEPVISYSGASTQNPGLRRAVSTTAGVSSERPGAEPQRSFAPDVSEPVLPISSNKPLFIGIGAAILVVAGIITMLVIAVKPSSEPIPAEATTSNASDAQAAVVAASSPAVSAAATAIVDAGPIPSARPAAADAPIARQPAVRPNPQPSPKPAAPAVVPAPAQPAQPSCDPPWFIDPVTHSRKVKPGC